MIESKREVPHGINDKNPITTSIVQFNSPKTNFPRSYFESIIPINIFVIIFISYENHFTPILSLYWFIREASEHYRPCGQIPPRMPLCADQSEPLKMGNLT